MTSDVVSRVEKQQGYTKQEYEVIFSSNCIDEASNKEIELQKQYGYKTDLVKYNMRGVTTLGADPTHLKGRKLTWTQATTTFPISQKEVKLIDSKHLIGMSWNVDGIGLLTIESEKDAAWIKDNICKSQFGNDKSYIYNKAYQAFKSEEITQSMDELFPLIRQWADSRGLYEGGDPLTQYAKLMEEAGELAQGLLKKNRAETIDAIGDMIVVLTNLAELTGVRVEDCLTQAYNEIKNRTGSMKNGTFVKDK